MKGYPELAVQSGASSSSGEALILDSISVIIVIYVQSESGKKSGRHLTVLG